MSILKDIVALGVGVNIGVFGEAGNGAMVFVTLLTAAAFIVARFMEEGI